MKEECLDLADGLPQWTPTFLVAQLSFKLLCV